MEQLIFFAVIIFLSILESVARSRKAKRGDSGPEELPDVRSPEGWEPQRRSGSSREQARETLQSYDDDPSYDDAGTWSEPKDEPVSAPRRSSSETLLPGDLLEELSKLAGRAQQRREEEQARARTVELPKQSPPLPKPKPSRRPAPTYAPGPSPATGMTTYSRPRPPTVPKEHAVHLAHQGWGTDPSERAPSEQDGLDPLREYLSEDAKAVRRQLTGRSASALRQAVILKEVLGPPLALRGGEAEGL